MHILDSLTAVFFFCFEVSGLGCKWLFLKLVMRDSTATLSLIRKKSTFMTAWPTVLFLWKGICRHSENIKIQGTTQSTSTCKVANCIHRSKKTCNFFSHEALKIRSYSCFGDVWFSNVIPSDNHVEPKMSQNGHIPYRESTVSRGACIGTELDRAFNSILRFWFSCLIYMRTYRQSSYIPSIPTIWGPVGEILFLHKRRRISSCFYICIISRLLLWRPLPLGHLITKQVPSVAAMNAPWSCFLWNL